MLKYIILLMLLNNVYGYLSINGKNKRKFIIDNEDLMDNEIDNDLGENDDKLNLHKNEDTHGPSWSYDEEAPDGPELWGNFYPACNGTFQSPINLKCSKFIKKVYRKNLMLKNYKAKPQSVELINNGHTVKLKFKFSSCKTPGITGGPLHGEYEFSEMHFHWGATNNIGSEHFIDSKQHVMEVHLVHFNKKYETIEEAIFEKDGLAVLGYLYRIKHSTPYMTFVKYLEEVKEASATKVLSSKNCVMFTLDDLVGCHIDDFITYEGSLTTPPCFESVQFIIASKILSITPSEISEFRQLTDDDGDPLYNNFRPLQKKNNRDVFFSYN